MKTIIILFVLFIPLTLQAQLLTSPNTFNEFGDELLEEKERWCDREVDRVEEKIDDLESGKMDDKYPTKRTRADRLVVLSEQLATARKECAYAKQRLLPTSISPNLNCADGYVLLGHECISYDANCKIHFGENTVGSKHQRSQTINLCECEEGYRFKDNVCVVQTPIPVIKVPDVIIQPEPVIIEKPVYIEKPIEKPKEEEPVEENPEPVIEKVTEEPKPVQLKDNVQPSKPTILQRVGNFFKSFIFWR